MRRLLLSLLLGPAVCAAADPIDFNRDVRPILSDKCFFCHGPDEKHRAAKLRLDVEKDAKADRDGTHAVVPGQPDTSELVTRITTKDETERMPPKKANKPLSTAEIETLTRWVKEGAKWSAPWAYIAPVRNPVPEVKGDWPAACDDAAPTRHRPLAVYGEVPGAGYEADGGRVGVGGRGRAGVALVRQARRPVATKAITLPRPRSTP